MDREDHRQPPGGLGDRLQQAQQMLLAIHIGGPVQGYHEILFRLQAKLRPKGRRAQVRKLFEQGVDHGVADEKNLLLPYPGPAQIFVGGDAGGEKPVADRIGDHPVDLFRHGPVAGANTAFHMCYPHPQFTGGNGAGHGRGHIPHHQTKIAGLLQQYLLVAHHNGRRLLSLSTGTNLQIDIRLGNAQLGKKIATHGPVIVLAGMDQTVSQIVTLLGCRLQGINNRRDLHKIRARPGD